MTPISCAVRCSNFSPGYRSISLLSVQTARMPDSSTHSTFNRRCNTNQAGFHQHRSRTEQVMALTTHVEAGFKHQLKTGAVFVDLTAAYDTVWREDGSCGGLEAVSCRIQ
jgi:hypothetical protein